MNLVQLRYFAKVCECGSVSGAAEALYISQPSVTGAIRELEADVGAELFVRHHHGVTPTDEGRELLKLADGLLVHADNVERAAKELGTGKKRLRLGVPPMIGALLLPHIYRDFLSQHPEIIPEITEAGRMELAHKLSEGLCDMVFLPHNAPFDPSLAWYEAAKLEIVFCTRKDDPLAKLSSVSPKQLEGIPLVLFKNSFFQTMEIKKRFAAQGIVPNILMQTEQLSTLTNLISSGAASGFMFRRLIHPDSELAAIPLSAPMYVGVSLVYRKNASFFGCMQSFLDFVTSAKANSLLNAESIGKY